jgi:excisionase family DNA binding protein
MTRYSDGETYLGVAETARRLLVTPKTVARWAREGRLPHVKTLGGHRKFPESEIDLIVDAMVLDAHPEEDD